MADPDCRRLLTGISPSKAELAQQLRRGMTPQERRVWSCLRANRLDGLHFRRRQVIEGFIVDFYCHRARLAVELDGAPHALQADYDAERDAILARDGVAVLRIADDEVDGDIESVMAAIAQAAMARIAAD